jgi:16S rRNA U516 pseudouridylate synthase RsuA-like enzyme
LIEFIPVRSKLRGKKIIQRKYWLIGFQELSRAVALTLVLGQALAGYLYKWPVKHLKKINSRSHLLRVECSQSEKAPCNLHFEQMPRETELSRIRIGNHALDNLPNLQVRTLRLKRKTWVQGYMSPSSAWTRMSAFAALFAALTSALHINEHVL